MRTLSIPYVLPAEVARLLADRKGMFWLDGDAHHGERGRFSFIGCDPVEVRRACLADPEPLAVFRGLLHPTETVREDNRDMGRVPAGAPAAERVPRWVGYLAYDAAWGSGRSTLDLPESSSRHPRDPRQTVAWLARHDACFAFDTLEQRAFIIGDDAPACNRLRDLYPGDVHDAAVETAPTGTRAAAGAWTVLSAPDHERAIARALDHMHRGDIYQVNLARRYSAPYTGPALSLALAMRRASPVPLGIYLDAGDHALIGRSMETFLHWNRRTGRLESRPIKGTIASAAGDRDDRAAVMRSDPKELAEHTMIVDLMRNDLGRIATTGTVRVEDALTVEPYAKLSHLVSTVACVPRLDLTVEEVLAATFPPGSVTGAPKVRAIDIIDALEPAARGIYTGCYGHIDRGGGMTMAVAIRTATIADGAVSYFAGGGIVEASQADREVAETELKARVFLDGLASLGGNRRRTARAAAAAPTGPSAPG